MANPTKPLDKFHLFLQLPSELRNRVYEYALKNDTVVSFILYDMIPADMETNGCLPVPHCYQGRLSLNICAPALPQVCRQIYSESNSILYEINTFGFLGPRWLNRFIDEVGDNVKHLRSVFFMPGSRAWILRAPLRSPQIWPYDITDFGQVYVVSDPQRFPRSSTLHHITRCLNVDPRISEATSLKEFRIVLDDMSDLEDPLTELWSEPEWPRLTHEWMRERPIENSHQELHWWMSFLEIEHIYSILFNVLEESAVLVSIPGSKRPLEQQTMFQGWLRRSRDASRRYEMSWPDKLPMRDILRS